MIAPYPGSGFYQPYSECRTNKESPKVALQLLLVSLTMHRDDGLKWNEKWVACVCI